LFQRSETDAAQYTNDNGARGVLRQSDDQVAQNLEFFAESQLALGRGFTGVFGFSLAENFRRNTRLLTTTAAGAPIANPAGTTYDRDFDNIAPKLGLRWDNAARNTQLYANVSGSYEPPSFSESGVSGATVVANRAQEALTYEVGTRGVSGPVRWDASVYHARVDDELLAIVLPGPVSGTLNADRTIHQGVELGLEADLLGSAWKISDAPEHRVVARGAWTYGDFRFDGPVPGVAGTSDNRIAGIPPHLIRGELVYEHRSGWYAGPSFEWVPQKSYVDHANTLWADPYALIGFKLGLRRDQGLSFFIEARNLMDETYAATHGVVLDARVTPAFGDPLANQRQFLPGDGRSLYVGAEYKF
jgi:iron complex outermembrane receptor protein